MCRAVVVLVTCEHPSPTLYVSLMLVGICVLLPSLPPTHSQECLSNLWSSSGQVSSNIFLHIDNCKCTWTTLLRRKLLRWKQPRRMGRESKIPPLGKRASMKTNRRPQRGPVTHANIEKREKQFNFRDVVDDPALELKQHGLRLTVCVLLEQ